MNWLVDKNPIHIDAEQRDTIAFCWIHWNSRILFFSHSFQSLTSINWNWHFDIEYIRYRHHVTFISSMNCKIIYGFCLIFFFFWNNLFFAPNPWVMNETNALKCHCERNHKIFEKKNFENCTVEVDGNEKKNTTKLNSMHM